MLQILFTIPFLFNLSTTTIPEVPEPTLRQELATTSLVARKTAITKTVSKYAKQYDVSEKQMMAVLECENNQFDPDLQSYHKDSKSPNGREQSYGVAQINLPWNQQISYQQATDPDFSIRFMARMFSQSKQYLWSCTKLVLAKK